MHTTVKMFTKVLQAVVPISDEQAGNFFAHFEPQQLAAEEYFVREGQVCGRIAFLETGMVRHFYLNEGEEVTRWMSLEGDFLTSLGSFILQKPSSHYLQAVNPCKMWVINAPLWWKLYGEHEILRSLWTRMMEINVIGFEDRVYQQLASDAEQRYLYFMRHYPAFIERVPQKYIASMIGIKPESLSRLRASISKKGKS